MKQKQNMPWVIGMGLLLCGHWAHAEVLPELMQFMSESVSTYDQALAESSSAEVALATAQEGEIWYPRTFFLRLRPKFGLDVPWVAKFQVIPELEMVWQRGLPEGYTNYKP